MRPTAHPNTDGFDIFVPDGAEVGAALARTTHLAIGAHPDDIPLMAFHGVAECFDRPDRWLLGLTVTNGSGSPRAGSYADYSDEQMAVLRANEEHQAAVIGQYSASVLLGHPSSAVNDPPYGAIVEELADIAWRARPEVVYTHSPADRHDTHVAVALRTITALRTLPESRRPGVVYGCEMWGDLDWLVPADRLTFDVSGHDGLAASLIGVYASQVRGGKRFDLAAIGRWRAHATFSECRTVDLAPAVALGMDLTPLIKDESLNIVSFVQDRLDRRSRDTTERIGHLSRDSQRT